MLQERASLNDADGCRISSQEDSPASHIALQENVKRLLMSVTYGENLPVSFAKLNPDGYWLKTSQGSVQVKMDGSLEEYCETWPKWGIMWGGAVGELPTLEPLTEGNGSSSWPTPTTQEVEHPTMEISASGRRITKNGNNTHSVGLADKVLWPSPTCRDVKGQNSKEHLEKERGHHDQLPNAIAIQGQRGSLNPDWVECLMGLPVGWTDIDGPPDSGPPPEPVATVTVETQ